MFAAQRCQLVHTRTFTFDLTNCTNNQIKRCHMHYIIFYSHGSLSHFEKVSSRQNTHKIFNKKIISYALKYFIFKNE